MPDDSDVSERLAAIERRLDRMEALLGAGRPTPQQSPAAPPRVPPVSVIARSEEPAAEPLGSVAPRPSLEQAIGLRWAGWVGAIVLVIGAGLGIEFAYRQGWFAIVSPAVRVGALVAIGAALIGAGEVVFRRVNVRSAVGLFAAGVAVLFLAAYAGFAFYDLYGRGTAFVLMACATVVGAAVARRGDLVSIAALSIVGGNLAPALLHRGDPAPVGFLVYLLTLQAVAVALAFRGGPKWWVLRSLSLATTALWLATVLPLPSFAGPVTVGFLILYAAVHHAELVASEAAKDADSPGSVPFGLFVTGGLTAGLLYLSRADSSVFRTTEVLALAAVAGGLAVALGRGRTREVGLGFAIQCICLTVLAVPVATSGPWVVAGWGIMAVALAVAGRWSTSAGTLAPVVWLLAAFDLILWACGLSYDHRGGDAWFAIADHAVPAYACMAWLLAIAGHAIAALTRAWKRVPGRAKIAGAVDGLAVVAWVGASLVALSPLGATTAVLVYAAVSLGFVPQFVGTAVAVAVAVKWMAWDTVLNRPILGSTVNAACVGLGVVAVLVGVGWMNRRRPVRSQLLRGFSVIVAVWTGSVFIDAGFARSADASGLAEQVALSVWWAIAAVTAVAAGFARRLPDLRYVGLGLLAITLLKVVIVDLSGVAAGWRVLSFLGLGGVLLATSVLYGRLGAGERPVPP